jgi:hypothetical protein
MKEGGHTHHSILARTTHKVSELSAIMYLINALHDPCPSRKKIGAGINIGFDLCSTVKTI